MFCVILRNYYKNICLFLVVWSGIHSLKLVMPIYSLLFLSLSNYPSGGSWSYLSTASCFLLFIYKTPLTILVAWSVIYLLKTFSRIFLPFENRFFIFHFRLKTSSFLPCSVHGIINVFHQRPKATVLEICKWRQNEESYLKIIMYKYFSNI